MLAVGIKKPLVSKIELNQFPILGTILNTLDVILNKSNSSEWMMMKNLIKNKIKYCFVVYRISIEEGFTYVCHL